MKENHKIIYSLFFILTFFFLGQAQVSFIQPPAASFQNNKLTITFEVSASIDVEAAILNAQGKIVRHLAAGVLGGTYDPPLPLAPGLSQSLEWDGFDDYYKSATGGPFKARVRLGITPEFERTVSTQVFTGNGYEYGPGGLNPTGDFLQTSHPVFNRICTSGERIPKLDLIVDNMTEEMYIKVYNYGDSHFARFNGITGQLLGIMMLSNFVGGDWHWWGEGSLSWNGYYLHYDETSTRAHHYRYTNRGQPAPWPVIGAHVMDSFYVGDMHSRGHAGGPDGSHYKVHYSNIHESRDWECPPHAVTVIDSNGNVVKEEFIVVDAGVGGGIRLDLQGNIYLAARVKPKGQPVPSWVEGKLSGSYDTKNTQAWWGDEMYGSILKFGPIGGNVRVTDGAHYDGPGDGDLIAGAGRSEQSGERSPAKAENLVWMYYGYSHVLTHNSYRVGACWCNVTRFDIDYYGRIFFPNTFEHQVNAMDNNRNMIFSFRNRDVSQAAIGLGHDIDVTDRALYLADHWNNQIVSFKLTAQKEATVDLPAAIEEGVMLGPDQMLIGNFPNPFKPNTTIRINSGKGKRIELKIYDMNMRLIKTLLNDSVEPGVLSVGWDGTDDHGRRVASGMYLYRLRHGRSMEQKKMVLMQ
jgi:hypothetical protein